jgi:hypothetical protein
MVNGDNAARNGQGAGNTTLYAQRLVAVAAGHGETDSVLLLNFYLGVYFDVF